MFETVSFRSVLIVLSWIWAAYLLVGVWRSRDPMFLKFALTITSIVPVVGPLIVLWLTDFPEPLPPALRDRYKTGSDVYDRWHDVLKEKNPIRRFAMWRRTMASDDSRKGPE